MTRLAARRLWAHVGRPLRFLAYVRRRALLLGQPHREVGFPTVEAWVRPPACPAFTVGRRGAAPTQTCPVGADLVELWDLDHPEKPVHLPLPTSTNYIWRRSSEMAGFCTGIS